jgi:hypothetical protein
MDETQKKQTKPKKKKTNVFGITHEHAKIALQEVLRHEKAYLASRDTERLLNVETREKVHRVHWIAILHCIIDLGRRAGSG